MKKLKSILGFLLIVLSVSGLFFWEVKGRDAVMMDEVLVAKDDIQIGTAVDANLFTTMNVPKSNLLEHALRPMDLQKLKGKVNKQMIVENSQIIPGYFENDSFQMKKNQSIYVIRSEWISMRSSSLRRGDIIDIYGEHSGSILGTFRIAYVKDEADREVKNAGAENVIKRDGGILERTDSSAVIDHIEIISTLEQYQMIKSSVYGVDGTSSGALLIVQRGERFSTKEVNNR